jgi:hypothetical protein
MMPPATGPAMAEAWKIDEFHATALGKCSRGTSKGASATGASHVI